MEIIKQTRNNDGKLKLPFNYGANKHINLAIYFPPYKTPME